MVIVWSERAQREFEALIDYIVQYSPRGAQRVSARIRKRIDDLAEFPDQGSLIGRGMRRLDVTRTPYIVLHKRQDDVVTIIAVLHVRRKRRA